MKKICITALGLVLSACAKEPPISETIADSALNATTGLEQSLPETCKTDAIKTQLVVVKTQIRAISKACESEKAEITREKLRWQYSFYGLIAIILVYCIRKIIK